jgi:hypothetical protein
MRTLTPPTGRGLRDAPPVENYLHQEKRVITSRASRGVVIYDLEFYNEDCFTAFAMTHFLYFIRIHAQDMKAARAPLPCTLHFNFDTMNG